MKLTGETKILIGILLTSVLLIVGAMFIFSRQEQKTTKIFTREELFPEGSASKGNASASAYLVEFSDFQCPACKAFAPLVADAITQYGEQLAVVYRHYPLTQHNYAEKAARAAEAAKNQDKFWEMHDELFLNQDKLSDETLNEIVKKIGLDEAKFFQDIEKNETKEYIAKEIAEGNRFEVNSTPTFFLNGQKLTLRSAQDLTRAIEDVLK